MTSPRSALVVGLDHEPAPDDVVLETTGTMQHGAQVDLGDSPSVLHAFLEVCGVSSISPLPPGGPGHGRHSTHGARRTHSARRGGSLVAAAIDGEDARSTSLPPRPRWCVA